MSATNEFETLMLEHYFQNADHTNVGDAAGLLQSSADGDMYISLHTGDPGEAGDQTTSEAAYTSYARVAVVRTAGGFTVAGNNVSNAALVEFPTATGGSESITHFGFGSAASAAGHLHLYGVLGTALAVSVGIKPTFAIGDLDVNAD